MKKLMVFSVILALLAGSVFAVDLGGEVIGTYVLVGGDTAKDENDDPLNKPYTHGSMNRVRLQGDGENDDGTFGGWMRVDGIHWSGNPQFEGYAWWKPIDQFLMRIGGNSDGIWGKEGVTGWMFRQRINDTGVVSGDDAWGSAYTQGFVYRDAFFGGYGDQRLALEITPIDMLGINIGLPFASSGDTSENTFKTAVFQLDLNLDFGNIALTLQGARKELDLTDPNDIGYSAPKVFAYFGLTSIENMSLDIGVGFGLPASEEMDLMGKTIKITYMPNIAAGVGLKYDISDVFGIKFRAAAAFGGSTKSDMDGVDPVKEDFQLMAEVLPYYAVSDSVKVFFNAGLHMTMFDSDKQDAYKEMTKAAGDEQSLSNLVGWHINPYIWVGEEWGPAFWAGIRVWSTGKGIDGTTGFQADKAVIQFEVPIAIGLSF